MNILLHRYFYLHTAHNFFILLTYPYMYMNSACYLLTLPHSCAYYCIITHPNFYLPYSIIVHSPLSVHPSDLCTHARCVPGVASDLQHGNVVTHHHLDCPSTQPYVFVKLSRDHFI